MVRWPNSVDRLARRAAPWLRRALDLVLPRQCAQCDKALRGDEAGQFCHSCWQKVQRIIPPLCPSCGRPYPRQTQAPGSLGHRCGDCRSRRRFFHAARCSGPYEGVLRTAVQRFKFEDQTSLAHPLAELLAETFATFYQRGDYAGIVHVPLSRHRLQQRGYDQAFLLARALAHHLHLPLWPGSIERLRDTQPQVGMSRQQRVMNVRGAFAVPRPERFAGATLLLVDDVVTTASTVNECSRMAAEAGAQRVDVLAVARSV